ncbi:MAG: xanthine dehydrogenase family protein subunit M, partial [Gammaproteobacteria bacterium]|nr:xanthine dehydrogenase family protein subunit M [Gammaproteobacteria bacterium]
MSRHAMYARPRNLEQAAALLGALDTGAMLIAGGQELMPYINYGQMEPSVLVDISGLKELNGISLEPDGALAIGALSVHSEIARDPGVLAAAPLLAHAVTLVGGGRQVHNRGTIG